MKKERFLTLGLVVILGAGLLTGCGGKEESTVAGADGDSTVRTIKIAHSEAGVPYSYVDDDGNHTGYDVEVLKLIDERLPEYEFEYIGTTQTDACAGVIEGKYQIADTNSFYTEERAKNYIIPEHYLGASVGGLILRKENADVDSWEEAASQGLKHVPIKSGDGWHYLVQHYNDTHPDNQLEFELTDSEDWAIGIPYVAEGRYDVFGTIKTLWETAVEAEDGAYHDLLDELVFNQAFAVKTYTLINKEETELAEKINAELIALEEEGKLSELATQFYGEDILQYIEE